VARDRVRLRELLRFTKHKTPGYGISREFYLSVLAAKAQLPTIAEIVSPHPEAGAIQGFGVPLDASATKEDITKPIGRGAYAVASKDRKTVLKLLVLPTSETGFNPDTLLMSPLGLEFGPEIVNRVRATWTVMQLTFEAHDPMVYPSLDFLLGLSIRMAALTDGVVADPLAERYMLPSDVRHPRTSNAPIWAADHVAIGSRLTPQGLNIYTKGMRKFAQPELEVNTIEEPLFKAAGTLLLSLAQTQLMGTPIQPGAIVGIDNAPMRVATGGLDRGLWEGIPCLELIPEKTGGLNDAIRLWSESIPRR